MKEIITQIQIDAKPEKVWQILIDLDSWPNWNPIVNKITGELKVGSKLDIIMADANGKDGKMYSAKVSEVLDNEKFSFIATMMTKFLFSANRIIELKESQNGTLLTQKEEYQGLMVAMMWRKLEEGAKRMLVAMNKALKVKAES